MNTEAINQLQQFISEYQLKKPDGIIAFDAAINLSANGQLNQSRSEIQVVTLREMMVVYIMTPLNESLGLPDMYSTEDALSFNYHKGKGLEIKGVKDDAEFIISITPLY